jgi:hypothetical protein
LNSDPQRSTVFFVPGFHSDVVWLDDQRDYAVILLGDLRQNLDICRVVPLYGFFLHELTYLKPYWDTHLSDRAWIRELIRQGRIGTGGSHSEPSETLIGGESIVRNILYGRLFHERVLGDAPLIYAPWDVFGHCAQLSQILKKSRFLGAVWSKHILGFHAFFFHQALDGTKIPHRRVSYSYPWHDFTGRESFLARLAWQTAEMNSYGFSCDVRIDAADFKPPSGWMASEAAYLRAASPRVILTGKGMGKFMKRALREARERDLLAPTTARDMSYYHLGTPLSRVELKIANRLAENAIINAEKFGAIGSLLGAKYPDLALDKAWRQVLFAQHHDAITGSCCDRVYFDLMAGYREALDLSSEALGNALRYLSGAIDTRSAAPKGKTLPIVVFNPLNWDRADICRLTIALPRGWSAARLVDHSGADVPVEVTRTQAAGGRVTADIAFIAQVPSLGYSTFYLVPANGRLEPPAARRGRSIENEFFRLRVDPKQGGGIISLYDKKAKRELLDVSRGPGNEVIALEEKPDRNEPPWELWTTGAKDFSRNYPAEVEVVAGPVSQRLIARSTSKNCGPSTDSGSPHGDRAGPPRAEPRGGRVQEIILYRGVRRIDFVTRLEDYRGGHDDLFVVTFPSALRGLEPVFEERFGACTRRKSKGCLDFRNWRQENNSGHGARAAYQWFAQSACARVEFGKAGGERSAAFALGMLALVHTHDRPVIEAAYQLQERLRKKGIFCTPMFDDGERKRRSQLNPEQDCTMPKEVAEDLPWGTSFAVALDVRGKNRYARKVLAKAPESARAAFRQRVQRDRRGYLFLLDRAMPEGWSPLPVLVISAQDGQHLNDAVDALLDGFDETAAIRLPVEVNASGIHSWPDDYTLALANRGNILNSLEADDTLALFLFHTSVWPSEKLGFPSTPEKKTHVYTYALHPHGGDWRAGKDYRLGFEFNNPLLAVPARLHSGPLPPALSFLRTEPENIVVTALKPAGNSTAEFKSAPDRKGLALRLYEATGFPAKAKVTWFQPLGSVESANLLEEVEGPLPSCGNVFADVVPPFSIQTYCLQPAAWHSSLPAAILGREVEPVQPVHFRHWQHNTHAEPLGYSAVALSLRPMLPEGTPTSRGHITITRLEVGVANNYQDRRIRGTVRLLCPDGWTMMPDAIDYDLNPGEHLTTGAIVAFTSPRRQGLVKARLEHDRQTIQDVIEIGEPSLLQWEVQRRGERIIVKLRHANDDTIEGGVSLISPMETWSPREVGGLSLVEIAPRVAAFCLGPNSEQALEFRARSASGEAPAYWALVKVFYNGRVEYKPVPGLALSERTRDFPRQPSRRKAAVPAKSTRS